MLSAADAVVVLQSASGTRRVPFNGFYTAYRRTVMRPDEIIAAIEIPPVEGRQWFRKVGTRAAQAISKVVMAAVRATGPARRGRQRGAHGRPGAARPRPCWRRAAPIERARAMLMSEIAPIDDVRSTAAYRRRVAGNLLAAFWNETPMTVPSACHLSRAAS